MLTYAKIAGGAPSSSGPMTKHLLNQTVPKEVADLARYYTRELEVGEDQALARRDMHPIVARGLGVDPEKPLGIDQLNALLSGHRADGEKIEGKTYSAFREYTDPKTGELKQNVPIGSVDFCLSPDKSVSVAWAFATPAEQAAIYQAHRDAAQRTMLYIEAEMAKAGRGKGGQGGYDQGHLGWVSFDHYTSRPTLWIAREENGERISECVEVPAPPVPGETGPARVAGDPELHTHFTVMNAVFCENGRVGSLDLDRLEGFIKESGALYQAHLAQNLRDMGAEVVLDHKTGSARLTAIPDAVRIHYSKKTTNGEEAAREYARSQGLDWDSLDSDRRTRLLKNSVQGIPNGLDGETMGKLKKDDMADFASWKRQAADLGWSHETIVTRQGPAPRIDRDLRLAQAREEALPWLEKELDARAVVSEHDVRTAALRGMVATGIDDHKDIGDVVRLFQEHGVRQQGEVTSLIFGQESDKRGRSATTGLHEMQETEFIKKAREAAADRSDALPTESIKAAVDRSGLDFTSDHGKRQLEAIHRLGEGGKLGVMIGSAGAGKSSMVRPLVDAWQKEGRECHGIALAWRQADDWLDAGISPDKAKATSVFLQAVEKGEVALSDRSVVVVDEMSLIGTRDALQLLRLREKHDFRLIMIGDDKQCQSMAAGPIIDLARKALGSEQIPEILSTVRQKTVREQAIAGAFREGRAAEAIAMKREDGTVELVKGGYRNAAERTAALLAERIQANRHDSSFTITVSTPTNMDAHNLSLAIREKRREMGEVGRDLIRITASDADKDASSYEMKIAAGDRVRLFHTVSADKQRGSIGRNGSVLTVLDANKSGLSVRNAKGKEGFVSWQKLNKDGRIRLSYGEVQTTHTAQGSTATEHIYAMPAGTRAVNGFSGYSSGARHKQKSFMVISEGAERTEVSARRPLNDPRPVDEKELWANVARNLGRQPTKATALDFLERASGVERGAARAMQRGLQPSELRERRGAAPTTLHVRNQRRQEAHDIGQVAHRLKEINRGVEPALARLASVTPQIGSGVEKGIETIVRNSALGETSRLAIKTETPSLRSGVTPSRQAQARHSFRKMVQEIPRDHIDQLKGAISLTSLVSSKVKLDSNGKGLCPFHDEKTPSFQVDEKKGHYHCFSGDTRLITAEGTFPFQALAGGTHKVLTRGGAWVDAPIRSFGIQKLWKIDVTRNGVSKTIHATQGHRWFVRGRKGHVTTDQLLPGHRLESVFPSGKPVAPSVEGIRHGIVFGDGSLYPTHSTVNLHDEKAGDLKDWFDGCRQLVRFRGEGKPYLSIKLLPKRFKSLPGLNESLEYLAGFVAGYLATDGHVASDGTVMLNSANPSFLEYVRTVCARLGIGTHGITKQMRIGYGTEETAIYRIHFVTAHLWDALILRPRASERFRQASKAFGRHRWIVRSVAETDRVEEVFCATVPEHGAFALEDNILTGNCFGCGCHGDAVTWLKDAHGLSFKQAIDFLGGKSGMDLPVSYVEKAAGKERSPQWVAVQTVPENAPALLKSSGWTAEVYNPRAEERGLERTTKAYRPDHVASYRDAEGRQVGYVLRMEMTDGRKFTPTVTWAIPQDAPEGSDPLKVGRWALVAMQDPRPLYRGEEIARNPDKTVIVVMGEKKADILQATLGSSAVVVSWAGGDNGRQYTDFSALKGRNVLIWPDADAGGKAAAVGEIGKRGEVKKGVADYAAEAGAAGVKVIVPPAHVEKGWDAGDLVKGGADRSAVKKFIAENTASVDVAARAFGNQPAVRQAVAIGSVSRGQGHGPKLSR